jgi:hypothetical protein
MKAWMSLMFVVCCVGSNLRDGLITRPEAPYQLEVCDPETSTVKRPNPDMSCDATEKKNKFSYVRKRRVTFSLLVSRIEDKTSTKYQINVSKI